jgi:hypothetical protein
VVGQISQIFIGSALAKLFARQVKALHRQQAAAAAAGGAAAGSNGDLKAAAAAAVADETDVELAEGSGKQADASAKLSGSTGSFEPLGADASRASGDSGPKPSAGAPGLGA